MKSNDEQFEFATFDEELETVFRKVDSNPIKEHLYKQLHTVKDQIDKVKNQIKETEDTIKNISNTLFVKAIFGEDACSDSDNDIFTVEGKPVLSEETTKKEYCQILVVKQQWQQILDNKWVIGVVLQNKSRQTLYNLRFYGSILGKNEIHGTSALWEKRESLWNRIGEIRPRADEITATLAFNIPEFEENSVIQACGTISYELDDTTNLQCVVPVITLTVHDIVNCSRETVFSHDVDSFVLSIKLISMEKEVLLSEYVNFKERLQQFLRPFRSISHIIYVIYESSEPLTYCMVEILPAVDKESHKLRISARSKFQLKLMMQMLKSSFPDLQINEKNDNCEEAAKALIEELEMYLSGSKNSDLKLAKIKTDLLIP